MGFPLVKSFVFRPCRDDNVWELYNKQRPLRAHPEIDDELRLYTDTPRWLFTYEDAVQRINQIGDCTAMGVIARAQGGGLLHPLKFRSGGFTARFVSEVINLKIVHSETPFGGPGYRVEADSHLNRVFLMVSAALYEALSGTRSTEPEDGMQYYLNRADEVTLWRLRYQISILAEILVRNFQGSWKHSNETPVTFKKVDLRKDEGRYRGDVYIVDEYTDNAFWNWCWLPWEAGEDD